MELALNQAEVGWLRAESCTYNTRAHTHIHTDRHTHRGTHMHMPHRCVSMSEAAHRDVDVNEMGPSTLRNTD